MGVEIAEIEALREAEFPVTAGWAYFDHAAQGPLTRRAADAARKVLETQLASGCAVEEDWIDHVAVFRSRAAELVGGLPSEIAILKNTTEGLALVANGLGIAAGENVVVPECEFPANVIPYLDLERRGVEVRFAPETEGRVKVDDVAARIDSSTRLVGMSFVEYATGFRNDLAAVAEAAHAAGALVSVDAIQGLGALQLDVREAGVDFLTAASYKWLLSPGGTAIFWCAAEHLDRLTPQTFGWTGVVEPYDFSDFRQPPAATARRFEIGAIDFAATVALSESISLLLEFGTGRVESRIRELTDRLVAGLTGRGRGVRSPRGDGEWSGIVSFRPRTGATELVAKLRERKIVARERGGAVRFSIHFYNTSGEIDRALEAIDELE